jgi:hypothetical protein
MDFMVEYQSALTRFTDQIANKRPIQYDPHLQNLIARFFALNEYWPQDWANTKKNLSKELAKTLPKDIELGSMKEYILVINPSVSQIIIGFYNGDIYTYNKVGVSWIKGV